MTDTQLTLALGLPSLIAALGILVNVGYFIVLNQRMRDVEQALHQLTSKVAEMDNRIVRIEDKLGIAPR
jgi:hypothetical protein